MKFDPTAPKANTAVGYGVHQLRVWTSFDRKLGWAQPWVDLWWQVPLAAKSDSLFQDPGFGATNVDLGQQAGASFGMQVYAVDDVPNNNQITVDVGTRFIAHFEGRDYSEMWEPFAFAGIYGAWWDRVVAADAKAAVARSAQRYVAAIQAP